LHRSCTHFPTSLYGSPLFRSLGVRVYSFGVTNFPVERTHYRWAPHKSSPKRSLWEGLVLALLGVLLLLVAVEAIVLR
jgi:hypothetical protein